MVGGSSLCGVGGVWWRVAVFGFWVMLQCVVVVLELGGGAGFLCWVLVLGCSAGLQC